MIKEKIIHAKDLESLYYISYMEFEIREFRDSDSVSEITVLLHRAYKPLADAGLRYLASHQNNDKTLERIKTGKCFVAEDRQRLIGTITYYGSKSKNSAPLLYRENGVANFGQFAVEPALQKQGLGSMLMNHVEQYAMAEGNHTICFDTSEHAHHLIDYYKKRGYGFEAYHQWEVTNYRSVIMKKSLTGFFGK
jgi:GNAT superfamily N-acetyltransferase